MARGPVNTLRTSGTFGIGRWFDHGKEACVDVRSTRKVSAGGAVALAALVSLVHAPAALAAGAPSVSPSAGAVALANPGDAQSFQNQATGRCIDDTDNGFRTWSCNGSNAQKWNIISWNDGTRQLRSVNTARCMEDTDNGFRTVQTCNSSREQSWWVKVWNDGSIRFQNQATGRCIDDSSLGFRTWACNDTAFQSWF